MSAQLPGDDVKEGLGDMDQKSYPSISYAEYRHTICITIVYEDGKMIRCLPTPL